MTPLDQIKDRLNIVDVISNYIRLERSGKQYKAKCPFHNEKTPSFYVSPQRNSFHCFGCNKGGNIFNFVMEIEHIEFYDAMKTLAKQAGVQLGEYNKEQNDNLYEIMVASCEFFQNNLSQSSIAKEYLHSRGLNDETIREYKIGFANNNWQDLYNHLIKMGFNKDSIISSGMAFLSENTGKVFDKWKGRVMFPIKNVSGIIVGYTGRILPEYDDGKQGKYVNSPETKIFKKGLLLFNYDMAKKYIAENREVIIAEGQMDVIMSHQAGVKNIIAVSGTAFTDEHIKMIGRLADRVILCFDNDNAGLSARNRTALLCAYSGLDVYNINIEKSNRENIKNDNINENNVKDIADIVKINPENWRLLVDNKTEIIMDYIYESNNIKDEKSKITYIKNNIIPYLKAINSPLERNRNINILSNNTGLSSEIIIEEIKNYKSIFEGVNNSKESIHIDPKIKNKEDILLEISVIREEIGDVIITDKLEQDVNIDNLVLLEINNNIVNIPEDLRNAKSIEINKSIIEKYDYYRDILNKYIRLYYEDKRKSLQELLISEIDQSKQEEIILEINNIDKIMKK